MSEKDIPADFLHLSDSKVAAGGPSSAGGNTDGYLPILAHRVKLKHLPAESARWVTLKSYPKHLGKYCVFRYSSTLSW